MAIADENGDRPRSAKLSIVVYPRGAAAFAGAVADVVNEGLRAAIAGLFASSAAARVVAGTLKAETAGLVGVALIGDGARAIGRDTANGAGAAVMFDATGSGVVDDGVGGTAALRGKATGLPLLAGGAFPCTCRFATVW